MTALHPFHRSIVALLLLVIVSGCAHVSDTIDTYSPLAIIAMPNKDVAALTADDIVIVLREAGFSDEQIIEHGTEIRNAIGSTGAVKMLSEKKVQAIIAVRDSYLHVVSRQRGSFVYDLLKCRIL